MIDFLLACAPIGVVGGLCMVVVGVVAIVLERIKND